jgi:ADP-heptose:LPS heptosyltransferase
MKGGDVGIQWTNESAGDIFPHERFRLHRLYNFSSFSETISMHDMVHRGRNNQPLCEHPTAQFMAHVGFPELSAKPIRPQIEADGDLPVASYDVLISPYILAEIERFWPLERWQCVIDWCRLKNLNLGVLCGTTTPNLRDLAKINPYHQEHFADFHARMVHTLTGVDYIKDYPLGEVVKMMRKAKAVVTIDSGPSRLAYAADLKGKHLLLCNDSVSREWGANPDAVVIYKGMQQLGATEVIIALKEILHG